jgi:hypothetical protein
LQSEKGFPSQIAGKELLMSIASGKRESKLWMGSAPVFAFPPGWETRTRDGSIPNTC